MKQQEKRYVSRINELEEKAEKHQKTESIVKSLKHDIPKIEDNVYLKLSEMEMTSQSVTATPKHL